MDDILRRDDLALLMATQEGPCVSLFMPTHRKGRDTQQDPIRLGNLLKQAEEKLVANGLRSTLARDMLAPAHDVQRAGSFWRLQSDGLAIFASPTSFRFYRLPLSFAELVVASHRFHLKPLLPLFTGDGRFFVLALSQNAVRLLEGTRHSLDEVHLQDVPSSLAEALQYDDPEKQLQWHTGTAQGGQRSAMFHGHGVGSDDAKDRILRYFHQIDSGLRSVLEKETAPLVLAAVDYLMPIYRQTNEYAHLLSEGVPGNPDDLKPDDLHKEVWAIVAPYFAQERQNDLARYRQSLGTGRASNQIAVVVRAAVEGRIGALFVPIGVHIWSSVSADGMQVATREQQEPGDEDLLDLAAWKTLTAGGVVYAVESEEMPDKATVAAVFRY